LLVLWFPVRFRFLLWSFFLLYHTILSVY
jgi:hypothetical protein